MSRKPLIAHVLYRLDTGGMEHFVVNLINHTGDRYRHALICLTEFGALRDHITDPGVPCLALHKRPGKDWGCYVRFWRAMRRLQPDLVQTYNIGALDLAPVAKLAGVPCVVHAERGRDAADPNGDNRKHRWLRRCVAPFVAHFLPVSQDLQHWLTECVGINAANVVCIPNGIDATQFAASPRPAATRPLLGEFAPPGTSLLATVGRLDAVKNHAGLIDAFRLLCDSGPDLGDHVQLIIVGGGAEHGNLERQIARLALGDRVRLLGSRNDVAALLAEADIFALSSIAEGMPGVLLEAMASGLPIVATDVGGVHEVVVDGVTGTLVPARDPTALAAALRRYVEDAALRRQHGLAGHTRVESCFSLPAMVAAYAELYDRLLAGRRESHSPIQRIGPARRREP